MKCLAIQRSKLWLSCAALAANLAAGCATGSAASGENGPGVGAPLPDLALTAWNGKPLRLDSYRGKVVLLDLWASWCLPCKDELPALDALASRWRARGVEIVAVSLDEDRAAAEAFLRTRKRWELTLAHDPAGAVADRLQPPKMPTSYVIDRAGVVRHVNAGYQPGDIERLEAVLRDLAR